MENDKDGNEGLSSKKMKLIDDEQKEVDKLTEEKNLLTSMATFFPDLVWENVLGNLGKKTDVQNCFLASPYFGKILDKKRQEKILPEVLEILGHYYARTSDEEKKDKATNSKSIPGSRPSGKTKANPMTELWKCRLISKQCNQTIEELYRNETDAGPLYIIEKRFAKNASLIQGQEAERFNDESELDKFLAHFDRTHYDSLNGSCLKCPFLARGVSIKFHESTLENNQAYLEKFMELLGKYGEEIWYFEIYCDPQSFEVGSYVYWYRLLNEVVKMMPNLKGLRVQFGFISEEPALALEQEVGANPFPKLEKLELITTFQVPDPVVNHLIREHRGIRALGVLAGRMGDELMINYDLFTDKLPNLTRLDYQVRSIKDFEMFENYPFSMKLVEFAIMFHSSVPFVQWSRVFEAIGSKLDPNLCRLLSIQLPRPVRDHERYVVLEESLTCRLKLNKLIGVWIQSKDVRFSLDFLLNLKKTLACIELSCNPDYFDVHHDNLQRKQVIKFLGYEDRMEDSNIHEQLPKLRYVVVNGRERKRRVWRVGKEGVLNKILSTDGFNMLETLTVPE